MKVQSLRVRLTTLLMFAFAFVLGMGGLTNVMAADSAASSLELAIPAPSDDASRAGDTYVGLTKDGVYGVGLVVKDGEVVAFVSDGWSVGHWLSGNTDGERVALVDRAGMRFTAELTEDAASGELALPDGKRYSFVAERAADNGSGLFRTTELTAGFTHGWIVLVDDAGLLTVRGLGLSTSARSLEVDAPVSVDDVDLGDGASPPASEPKADSNTIVPPGLFTCETLKTVYDATVWAANRVKSDALMYAYMVYAFEWWDVAWEQGCEWAGGSAK